MPAIAVLGHVPIPEDISAMLPAAYEGWPRNRRSTWEYQQRRNWEPIDSGRGYLQQSAVNFLDATLKGFGIEQWEADSHSLLLFQDVERHPDDGIECQGKAGAFFHVMLEGSGTLHLSGLRNKKLRKLRLEKGLAFWFNPRVYHSVSDASPKGLASLSAIIRLNSTSN